MGGNWKKKVVERPYSDPPSNSGGCQGRAFPSSVQRSSLRLLKPTAHWRRYNGKIKWFGIFGQGPSLKGGSDSIISLYGAPLPCVVFHSIPAGLGDRTVALPLSQVRSSTRV